jgi:cadmium resistance protein CadD (predicted permease)
MTSGTGLAATLASAVVVFATTNVDDIVLLSVLFADSQLRPRAVAMGQFVGIGVLVLVSALAGAAAVAIPSGWTSLLGAIPLLLGLYKGARLVRSRGKEEADDALSTGSKIEGRSQMLAVAGVTLANGGDNLSVYIPQFAADRRAIVLYVVVFAVMTALWCALGFKLVDNRIVGAKVQRYGHVILPIVLIALGAHILSGARALL